MISSESYYLGKVGTSGSTDVIYIRPKARCTILSVRATSLHSTGAQSATVTVADPSANSVGVATFAADAGVGALATYAADSTYGTSIFGPDETTNTYFSVTVSDETVDDYLFVEIVINHAASQSTTFA